MNHSPRAYRHRYTLPLLFACAIVSTGCMASGTMSGSSGYQRFTLEELKHIDRDELPNVQFFTNGALRLSTGEKAVDDSLATEAGKLMKIQTRQHHSVEIPSRTPGVLVELGNDWIDLDVGDGVVLRFRATGESGEYSCVALNGQPIQADQPDSALTVEFEGEKYDILSARPVYLEYFVRHVVNVDRASQTIGGKRIDDKAADTAKKTASGY